MRIGMILDKVFPPDPRVENEAIELIKEGHEVFLFCLTYSNEKSEELINEINVRRYSNTTLIYKFSALAYTVPVYSYCMKNKIDHFIKANNIEAIHIHDMIIAEACFLANKKYQLPTVLDLHENRPEILKFYPYMQKLYGKLLVSVKRWKKKEEEFVKKSDKIVVVTDEAKNELSSRVPSKTSDIIVVPNTIRKSFYNNKKDVSIPYEKRENEFNVLYLGDTGERRGLRTVIEALHLLKSQDKIHNIIFLVIGKINDSKLVYLVDKYNLQNHVKFVGWQNQETFPCWISNADVCVSPLHKNLHHDTTYANKLFQYMSLGKALLLSDVLAQKELLERVGAGLVHKEQNAQDFANKLLELYNDDELRNEMGKKGEKFVREEFTWDKTSNQLKEIYKTII